MRLFTANKACKQFDRKSHFTSAPSTGSTVCGFPIQWIAHNKLNIPAISHILDDFILVGPAGSSIAHDALAAMLLLCKICNIPIKQSKTVPPSTCVVVHGIELDTVVMQARLPQDKLTAIQALLDSLVHRRRITLRELQSAVGLLNFACKVIVPGRPFLRRMINLTIGVTEPHHHISLNAQARADIAAWRTFLTHFNGINVFPDSYISDSEFLRLYSDASGLIGCAGVFGSKWFAVKWPHHWTDTHITAKEMLPITIIAEIWGFFLRNKRVLFHTDNSAVADIINKQTCRDPLTMNLVRRLVVACLRHNIVFRAVHIKGSTNLIPDKLSRFLFQDARDLAPWLDPTPTEVPQHLLSQS